MKHILFLLLICSTATSSLAQTLPRVRVATSTSTSAPWIYTQMSVDTLVNQLTRRVAALEALSRSQSETNAQLTDQLQAALKSVADLINFINLNTLVPSATHFDTTGGVLTLLPVKVDTSPLDTRLKNIEAWQLRISQITLK